MLIETPPSSELGWITKFVGYGIRDRFLSLFGISVYEHTSTSTFFNKLYSSRDLSILVDGHLDWYLRPLGLILKFAPELFHDVNGYAVDLGTGTGNACRWLYNRGWTGFTLGIDFLPQTSILHKDIGERHEFQNADINKPYTLKFARPVTLFIAVNIFTYLNDPVSTLKHLHDMIAPNGRLMIIEPYPSLLWRLQANTRDANVWHDILKRSDWHVISTSRTAALKYCCYPILPFAQAYFCETRGK